jgi:molybdenum cofactor cytidylyltransferase
VTTSDLRFAVAILGAGASSRMGKPKLLLPWGDTSVLGSLLRQWTSLDAEQIAVVHARDDHTLLAELERLSFHDVLRIPNDRPERGMFSSIQCASAWSGWKTDMTHWLVVLGDQPHLRTETLRSVLAFAAEHPDEICQPSRNGRGRHPVVLPKYVFEALKQTLAETLKQFIQSSGRVVARCEIDDPGLDLDIDYPADYEAALRLAQL